MSKLSHAVESILFRSRFLLAPLYLGLVGALALLAYRFIVEFWHLAEKTADMSASEFTLSLLALLDLTLLANLILMVIFAGYENFVSRIDIATESKDRPHWMGTIDFSGLKIKLIGSLVAISVIELLKDFSINPTQLNSLVVKDGKKLFTHSTAVLQICKNLSGGWKLLYLGVLIPRIIRDKLYTFVAERRHKIFKNQVKCENIPSEVRERILN